MRERSKFIAIDLFSGCGGLTTGLEEAGFSLLLSAEIRAEARQTYHANHPRIKVSTDVKLIDGEKVLKAFKLKPGQLDLLAACPPCQGFSSIRTRNKDVASDERNDLIFEVSRLAQIILPKCILIENVPRLLTDNRLELFMTSLKQLGYVGEPKVVDAQDYGVPQRRKRMILILSRVGAIDVAPPSGRRKTVRDAIGNLPNPDSNRSKPLHKMRQRLSDLVLERISCIKRNRSELPARLVLPCHRRYNGGFRDVYGRMDWDKVSPTITRSSHNPSKGRFVHPEQNRGLTLYEALLLQGFPKNYKFPKDIGIGKIASMIGEAVPPPLAKAQAEHILKNLKEFEKSKRRKH